MHKKYNQFKIVKDLLDKEPKTLVEERTVTKTKDVNGRITHQITRGEIKNLYSLVHPSTSLSNEILLEFGGWTIVLNKDDTWFFEANDGG